MLPTAPPPRVDALDALIGETEAMRELRALLRLVAGSDATVLITGEHGAGKELCARAVHEASPRAARPFVIQHGSATNEGTLDSQLFGHVKGAFTDADSDKPGLFSAADGGTLFLDEVAAMSPGLQVKLLRVLQEGTFFPVGANRPVRVDVRIVAATHRPLEALVAAGTFREDLFYRLNVVPVRVPPLRERRDDLPLLVEHLLARHAPPGATPAIDPSALVRLRAHDWPGNVRELENELQRAAVMAGAGATLSLQHFSERLSERRHQKTTLPEAVEALEREWIGRALAQAAGNKSEAARVLGVSRRNLIRKCARYGLR